MTCACSYHGWYNNSTRADPTLRLRSGPSVTIRGVIQWLLAIQQREVRRTPEPEPERLANASKDNVGGALLRLCPSCIAARLAAGEDTPHRDLTRIIGNPIAWKVRMRGTYKPRLLAGLCYGGRKVEQPLCVYWVTGATPCARAIRGGGWGLHPRGAVAGTMPGTIQRPVDRPTRPPGQARCRGALEKCPRWRRRSHISHTRHSACEQCITP